MLSTLNRKAFGVFCGSSVNSIDVGFDIVSGCMLQCIDLAEIYVPQLVETLQLYAAPDKLCGETKLCPSSAMLLFNDAHTCKMCTDFTTEALQYIQSNRTEAEILKALHSQCANLGDFSSRVRNGFNQYCSKCTGTLYMFSKNDLEYV